MHSRFVIRHLVHMLSPRRQSRIVNSRFDELTDKWRRLVRLTIPAVGASLKLYDSVTHKHVSWSTADSVRADKVQLHPIQVLFLGS